MKKLNVKGTRNQDLIAARAELKAFRHDVALLKRKGLLDKKYDARSVTPTKYLKSQVKKFANVVSGKSQVAKISSANKKYYEDLGYTVKGNRIVVPVNENEKVYSSHGDFRIKTTGSNGSITTIQFKVPRNDVTKWADAMKKQHVKLAENETLAFQLYGYNAARMSRNIKFLIEYLEAYRSFEDVAKSANHHQHQDYIRNVVIYKIERGTKIPEKVAPEVTQRIKENRAAKRRRWVENMGEQQHEKYLDRRAEEQREYRKRVKQDSDPATYLRNKEKARERAKKSYDKRKEKK